MIVRHVTFFKMLSQFKLLNPQDARKIMQRSTLKTAPHDPIPASLFKDNMEILIPYVCNIVNTSIKTCIVPPLLKHSVITPIYKQKQLDVEDVANYRPISQLPGKKLSILVASFRYRLSPSFTYRFSYRFP